MSDWRRSSVLASVAVLAFLVIQLTIPISRIGDSGGGTPRFAWHMFSVSRPDPQFVVETPDGSIRIDIERYLARVRDDIDFETLVPPHLCAVVPSAELVVWEAGQYEC